MAEKERPMANRPSTSNRNQAQMEVEHTSTRAKRHAAQTSRHILAKEKIHPEELEAQRDAYLLIPLPRGKKYNQRAFLTHLSETYISEQIDKEEELEALYIQELTNCHIPTDKTVKQHPDTMITGELARLPRNIVRNAKIRENGIGPAVLIKGKLYKLTKGKKGSQILKALTQLGPYLYLDTSCRIIAANKAAIPLCYPKPETKEKRTAHAQNAPFWLTDAWIMEELADPQHILHNSNITFWQLTINKEDTDKQVNSNILTQNLKLEFLTHQDRETFFHTLETTPWQHFQTDKDPNTLQFQREEELYPEMPVRPLEHKPRTAQGLKRIKF